MRLGAVVLLAACLAVAGCGYANPHPRDQAKASAKTFLESCARNDSLAAIDVLTEPLQASFSRAGSTSHACSRFLGVGAASQEEAALLTAFRRTRIASLEVQGGLARASLVPPEGKRSKLDLRFADGEWKVESPPVSPRGL
jgi:hypothetical protein